MHSPYSCRWSLLCVAESHVLGRGPTEEDFVTEVDGRRSRRFSWDEVDELLVRKLLKAFYMKRGLPDESAKAAHLGPAQLRREAARILGRPPKAGYRRELTEVLLDSWVPKASPDVLVGLIDLVRLTLGADERSKVLTTQKQRVTFLRNRRQTPNFVKNLWDAFVSAHKEEVIRPARSAAAAASRSRAKVELAGEGVPSTYRPYEHQKQTWEALDRLRAAGGRRSGLMVIPTGGGKTATMVTWLVKEMQRRPELRVLWIADQQELIDQAVREFERQAKTASPRFRRSLRAVHSSAGSVAAALGDKGTDVVCTTRQSLVGRQIDRKQKATIKAFLSRPVVVVVDEAHHAVSPTYQKLIDFLWDAGRGLMLIGMTATPWPTGAGQTAKLRATFAKELMSVSTAALVASGDLARPVVHTVSTDERIEATDQELRLMAGREVPAAIARQLDRESRNTLVVKQWMARHREWGKTLVYACDRAHAESLGDAFRVGGADVDVLHSSADVDRSQVLHEFRNATEPRILVSVNMLLEGVDIPSARTAFLCRPTASRIVMRQMIGRVLRGVRAGGDAEAHIVDFVDQWSNQADVLSPIDIPNVPVVPTREGEGASEHPVPLIIADDGETEIGPDLLRSISRAMAERVRISGLTATLTSSRLVGFYDLDARRVPVFAYAAEEWEEVAAWALDTSDKRGTTARSYFDEVPPPTPVDDEVAAFVDYCKSNLCAPPFTPLSATVDIAAAAQRLIDAGQLTEHERIERLRTDYESTLARSLYPTLQAFIEAVEQEKLARLKVIPSGARPEAVPAPEIPPTQKLRRDGNRDLQWLVAQTLSRGMELLAPEPEYQEWLDPQFLPQVEWTRKEHQSLWGYWSWRKTTRAQGKPVIRINLALRAPKSQISDALLMYLIWHELCHHLTPGQGHHAEFRRLESLWPNHPRLDHELDTLHEKYALPTRLKR